MKTCSKCGEKKPISEFFRRKAGSEKRHSRCKACHNKLKRKGRDREKEAAAQRRWRAKNPGKARAAQERSATKNFWKAKIARSDNKARGGGYAKCTASVEELMATFTHICMVCGDLSESPNMDHDHETGKFRGWLCPNCNRALGQLRDSEANIESLLLYLRRHKPRSINDGKSRNPVAPQGAKGLPS